MEITIPTYASGEWKFLSSNSKHISFVLVLRDN